MQKTPNPWSCAITALALFLDEPVQSLIEEVGHDGGETIFESEIDLFKRRAFSFQELIDICIKRKRALIPIDRVLIYINPENKVYEEDRPERFFDYINKYEGLLAGRRVGRNIPHVVCWKNGMVIDPTLGGIYDISNFDPEIFLIIT